MKFSLLFSLISFIFLITSCRKDAPINTPEEEVIVEKINPLMEKLQIGIHGHGSKRGFGRGGYSGPIYYYDWILDYRLLEGYQKDNAVFYPIEKKWKILSLYGEMDEYSLSEIYNNWEQTEDWYKMPKLYRFNKAKNIAEIYKHENDLEPETIMNFNLIIGEKWFFDEEGEIGIEVVDKFEFESNGETYPALVVHYLRRYPTTEYSVTSSISDDENFVVSPLNPNPIIIGDYYSSMIEPKWDLFQKDNEEEPDEWIYDFSHCYSCDYNMLNIRWQFDSTETETNSYPSKGFVQCRIIH